MPRITNKMTLREAADMYLAVRDLKPSTEDDYRYRLTKLSDWLDKPISDITPKHVQIRHAEIKATAPRQADLVFTVFGTIFKYIQAMGSLESDMAKRANPVDILVLTRQRSKNAARIEDYVRDHELGPWMLAIKRGQNKVASDYFTLLVMTGLRRTEAYELTWSDIDLENALICIPKERTKNGRAHTIPLSMHLLDLLTERKMSANSQWVFPSPYGSSGHMKWPDKFVKRVSAESGVRFSPHSCRRTFVHVLSHPYCQADETTMKALLNHTKSDTLWRHYLATHFERLRPVVERASEYILKKAETESQRLGALLQPERPFMLRIPSQELVHTEYAANAFVRISDVDQVIIEGKILAAIKKGYHRKKDFYSVLGGVWKINDSEMDRILSSLIARQLIEAYKPENGMTNWRYRFRTAAMLMLPDKTMPVRTEDLIIDVECSV